MTEIQTRGSTSGTDPEPVSPQVSSRKLRIVAPARAVAASARGGGWWVAVFAVAVLGGMLVAVLGARSVARSDANRQRLASHLVATDIASTLKLAIRGEENITVSTSAFVASNPHTTGSEFDAWVESTHAFQRYPELQNMGLVKLIPASQLSTFKTRSPADSIRILGPKSAALTGSRQILPPGRRPYYCLAVEGVARSAAAYLPGGLDYCDLSKVMITARESGLTSYAPVTDSAGVALGVETPVYRGGATPSTPTARRQAFIGWLGELIKPNVLLDPALDSHPNVGTVFRYDSPASHVQFTRGTLSGQRQRTTIPLLVGRAAGLANSREGWTVQVLTARVANGVFGDSHALELLLGGITLSGLIGLLVLILVSGRTRARRLVLEKTRELSEKNRQLSEMATHDALTGLPNRTLVLDRAGQLLARAARQPNFITGALFIDVDEFKHVNDEHGHAAGDQVLRTVAERLQRAVRKQDTIGRLSGDEFVVIAECTIEDQALSLLAERVIEFLREPVEIDEGRKVFEVTASIGVASGQYETPDALLRDADLALYAAKAAGKDRYARFDTSMRAAENVA